LQQDAVAVGGLIAFWKAYGLVGYCELGGTQGGP
jgi:hypothetical protein